ncbi:MAG: PmoA family protein [Saprospiraceae bacterium]|nr:PmoA family protein [Saprospiraceae bacterium]
MALDTKMASGSGMFIKLRHSLIIKIQVMSNKQAPLLNLILCLLIVSFLSQIQAQTMTKISMYDDIPNQEVVIKFGDHLFTKYLYHDDIEKPVLYPIYSPHGKLITRGYPLLPIPGERTDHPHHLGLWFNYGNVNGLDFWNNSSAIDPAKKDEYGEIRHQTIIRMDENGDEGTLVTSANWVDSKHNILLYEDTRLHFSMKGNTYVVDRTTTLTAKEDVLFEDNKEGMLGLRVTRALELPADGPATFTDAQGNPTTVKVLDNAGVSGDYLSSTGLTGNDVWGTRGEWVRLSGKIDGEPIAVVMIDHPDNPGYPTHWHARGYGLFAANTLGQHAFNKDLQLNFKLKKGESATFRYRVLFHDGSELTSEQIKEFQKDFIKE